MKELIIIVYKINVKYLDPPDIKQYLKLRMLNE